MTAVEHEFFRGEPRRSRCFIQMLGAIDQFIPAVRGVNVDFDDAGVRGHAEGIQARVRGWLVTFHHDRQRHRFGGGFEGRDYLQIIFQRVGGRHENIEHAVTRLCAHRGACDPLRRLVQSGFAIQCRCLLGCHGRDALTQLLSQLDVCRERRRRVGSVTRIHIGIFGLADPGLRIQWQSIAHG